MKLPELQKNATKLQTKVSHVSRSLDGKTSFVIHKKHGTPASSDIVKYAKSNMNIDSLQTSMSKSKKATQSNLLLPHNTFDGNIATALKSSEDTAPGSPFQKIL